MLHTDLPDAGQRTHFEIDIQLPTPQEKAALEGTAGSPSSSNKYVTAEDLPTTPAASKGVRTDANNSILATAPVAARVYNSSRITIADSTATYLTFNSERFDTGGCHSTSTNTGRLTVPTGAGGVYLIVAMVQWPNDADGYRTIEVLVNRTTQIGKTRMDGADTLNMLIATVYQLAEGDYIEVRVWQNSGGNLDVETAPAMSPEFAFARIS